MDSVNDIRSLCDAAFDSIRTLFIEFKMKDSDRDSNLVYKKKLKTKCQQSKTKLQVIFYTSYYRKEK